MHHQLLEHESLGWGPPFLTWHGEGRRSQEVCWLRLVQGSISPACKVSLPELCYGSVLSPLGNMLAEPALEGCAFTADKSPSHG